MYEHTEHDGTEYNFSLNEAGSDGWIGGTNFADNYITSVYYYCDGSFSCKFTFCEYSDCDNSGWIDDFTCISGQNTGSIDWVGDLIDQNDELSAVYVSSFVCFFKIVFWCFCKWSSAVLSGTWLFVILLLFFVVVVVVVVALIIYSN